MPIPRYGVLKGRPIDRRFGAGENPHYHIRVVADNQTFRVAFNVKSEQNPSELLYFVNDRFEHPICDFLLTLDEGFRGLAANPRSGALDFIRGNLFDPHHMVPLPFNLPGPDNDLNEKLDAFVQRALAVESAEVFVYGAMWGGEPQADRYFGFTPGRGMHEAHMNQGNSPRFRSSDGVWQDGGLIFHFPHQRQWVALFTAFQSQAWHTDDQTGHMLPILTPQLGSERRPSVPTPGLLPDEEVPDGLVRIIGALVNPPETPERETVTILNTSNRDINLKGWSLMDKQKNRMFLSGLLSAGSVKTIAVKPPMNLSNSGGIITLLDARGRKISGVSYTKAQADNIGWTIPF